MDSRWTRRRFLGTTIAAGTGLGLGAGCSAPAPRETGSAGQASITDFELDELTLAELAEGMETGRLTARRITELYLERVEAIDRSGPLLRSIIELNPEAIAEATARDDERARGASLGTLHGIPVLVKDNLATADRMTTTAGSLALEGCVPAVDSFVARKLREAGAVLLGKANLSEWANMRSTRSSSGWSGRGGQCKNPFVLNRNPCGSSSGSGAAVSANLAAVAIGTETDGSIVCPSNANGLVGIKPTLGLVSRAGIVPIAHSQDTAGPMARTVADAARVLGAIAGVDRRDEVTASSEGRAPSDYTQFLDPSGLSGKRLGIARQYFGFHSGVDRVLEEAIEAMRRLGAEIVDPVELPPDSDVGDSELTVLLYEFKADLNVYLADLGDRSPMKTLADLIAFNDANREREMPWFGQEIFLQAEEKGPLTEPDYLEALARNRRLARAEGIDATVARHRLDAIVGPTGGPAWATDLVNGDHFSGGCSTLPAVAGYPNVTVPAGDVHGLPIGVSFFGPAWSEPTLLACAYAFERETQHRKKPRFLESLV